jgi:hypothetical protein
MAGFFMRVRMSGMKHGKLRIAWSISWGILSVVLIALWIRSQYYDERVCKTGNDGVDRSVGIGYGTLSILRLNDPDHRLAPQAWHIKRKPLNGITAVSPPWFLFYQGDYNGSYLLLIAFWWVVLAACFCTAAPWIRWSRRFTLRTLLIATTLVAVVLGVVVYFAGSH